MYFYNTKRLLGAMIGAAAVATVSFLPAAQGEMVYEGKDSRTLERSAARQSLAVSPQAEVDSAVEMTEIEPTKPAAAPVVAAPVVQAVPAPVQQQAAQPQIIVVQQPAQQQAVQPVQAAPVVTTAQSEEKLSKSELLRRKRMREELKNEDVLQERLETIRLRDEEGRVDKLVGNGAATGPTGPVAAEEVKALPVKEVVVTAPVGAGAVAVPKGDKEVAKTQQDQLTSSQAAAVSGSTAEKEDKIAFSIMPRAGVSSMSANTGYDIKARYSAGISLGAGISDHVGFDVGYTYSEYGVSMASNNYYVNYAQMLQQGYQNNPTFETLAMRQHLVDAGIKLYFLGPESRIRPFVGGGGGYARSSINYDQRILDGLARMGFRNAPADYTSNAFLGYLSAGLELRISKNISIGTLFKYYTVLSARETQVNNGALYSPGYYGGYGYGGYYGYNQYANVDEKQMLGSSLIRSGFYSIQGGVSFNF